jgi:hypothetical protein
LFFAERNPYFAPGDFAGIDLHPLGVEGVFGPKAAELVEILAEIERRSAA